MSDKETNFKLSCRKACIIGFPIFLVVQNIVAYAFVYGVTFYEINGTSLEDIQPILSVLIAGTIGQTVYVIKIMVKWAFTDSNKE